MPTTSATAPVAIVSAPAAPPPERPLPKFGLRMKKGDTSVRFDTVAVFTTAGVSSVKLYVADVECPKSAWESGETLALQLAPRLQPDGSTRSAVRSAAVGGAIVPTKGRVEVSSDGQKLTASGLVLGEGADALSLDGSFDVKACGPMQLAELPARPQPKATFTIAGKTMPLLGAVVAETAGGAWTFDVSTGTRNCAVAGNGLSFGVLFQSTGEASGSLSGDLVAFNEPVAAAAYQPAGAPQKKPAKTAPKPPYDKIKKGRDVKGSIPVDVDIDTTIGGYTVKLKGKLDAAFCPAPLPLPPPKAAKTKP